MNPSDTGTAQPGDRSTQFVAVEGGGETTSAEAMLIAAYVVLWALLLGVVLLGARRQRALDERLARLESALARLGDKT